MPRPRRGHTCIEGTSTNTIMKINKENYPAYFLDYYEGRLSSADASALFVFLDEHPEFRHDFDAFRPVSLEPDHGLSFPGREALKRGYITSDNCGWYFAAYAEGDLDASERKSVEAFVADNPGFARDLQLYVAARLDGADTLAFPGKASLRRAVVVPMGTAEVAEAKTAAWIPLWKYISAAAVVMLLAGLFFLRLPEQHDPVMFVDQNIHQETPVADGADIPVAVAEVPSRQQAPAATPGSMRGLTEPDQSPISGNRTVRISRPAGSQDREAEKPSQEKTSPPPPAKRLPSIPVAALEHPTRYPAQTVLDTRTSLAYWTPEALPGPADDLDAAAAPGSGNTPPQLALARALRSDATGFSKVEERIAENKFPLRELASLGLSRLGTLAADRLGLEAQKDEDGRIVQLSLGERFEARRE